VAIAFDATVGNSASVSSASVNFNVTVAIQPGETAFLAMLSGGNTGITITGGGTWTLVDSIADGAVFIASSTATRG
jgi:hypothetical protein